MGPARPPRVGRVVEIFDRLSNIDYKFSKQNSEYRILALKNIKTNIEY
jgi:hypothetical protein